MTVPPINSTTILLEDHGHPFPVMSVAFEDNSVVHIIQIVIHSPAVSAVCSLKD